MTTYTKQEAFDRSTRGIIAQGGPAYSDRRCKYLAPDGRKCAIGQLVEEGNYTAEADKGQMLDTAMAILDVDIDDENFASDLQQAHDQAAGGMDFWQSWFRRLTTLADVYKLNPTVLGEIPVE